MSNEIKEFDVAGSFRAYPDQNTGETLSRGECKETRQRGAKERLWRRGELKEEAHVVPHIRFQKLKRFKSGEMAGAQRTFPPLSAASTHYSNQKRVCTDSLLYGKRGSSFSALLSRHVSATRRPATVIQTAVTPSNCPASGTAS